MDGDGLDRDGITDGPRIRRGRRGVAAALIAALLWSAAAPGAALAQTPSEPAPAETPQGEAAAAAAPPAPSEKEPPLTADPISAEFAKRGLSAVIARLEALAEPSPEELFALAGARFLRAVERASQQRYRFDLGQVDYAPMLRLPLPRNAKPEPFDPAVVEIVFTGVLEDMAGVEAALSRIPSEALEGDAFGVTLSLDDLWIDVNANGARDEAGPATETMMDLAGALLGAQLRGMRGTLIRFDAADVAWLRAYGHLLSGVSELVLSVDPTAALTAAQPGWEAGKRFTRVRGGGFGMGESLWIDQAASALLMLRGTPDGARTRAALGHLQAMIAQNRVFWTRVKAEGDDRGEWIPNPNQTSALGGVRVDAQTAEGWLAVLGDLERVLKGELLAPYWRYDQTREGAPAGINLRRVLEDPAPFDLVLWIQGAAAAPYLEAGEVASGESMNAFERLVTGRAMMFALWFN